MPFHLHCSGEQSLGFTGSALKVMTGHTRCVTGLALAPRGGHLLSCSLDGTLRLWDYVQGVTVAKFTHHEEMRWVTGPWRFIHTYTHTHTIPSERDKHAMQVQNPLPSMCSE